MFVMMILNIFIYLLHNLYQPQINDKQIDKYNANNFYNQDMSHRNDKINQSYPNVVVSISYDEGSDDYLYFVYLCISFSNGCFYLTMYITMMMLLLLCNMANR